MNPFYKLLALSAALFIAACTSDNIPDAPDSGKLYDISLSFDINVDASSRTRAPRPFTSTDCLQDVDDVRIYVFRSATPDDDGSFLLYDAGAEMMKNENDPSPHIYVDAFESVNTGRFDYNESHSYTLSASLPQGYYRFLAIGRDDEGSDKENRNISWKVNETSWKEAIMTNQADNARVTEFFSGYPLDEKGEAETIHIDQDGEAFLSEITLHRAVAGVFLYVENIPVQVAAEFTWDNTITKGKKYDVTEVAVVAAGYDSKLNMLSRTRGNGFLTLPDSPLGLVKLASIAKTDENKNIFNLKPNPEGSFIFPADLYSNPISGAYFGEGQEDCSMALCFYSGDFPLKLLPIRMARTETVHPEEELDISDHNLYEIFANHLYCLGNYNNEDGTDNPVDLEEAIRDHKLEITVVAAWQAIVDIEM